MDAAPGAKAAASPPPRGVDDEDGRLLTTRADGGAAPSASATETVRRVRGQWTLEEDENLRKMVETHGASNWARIAKGVTGRSSKSCRLRWCNQLNPGVYRAPFSEWEDAVVRQAYEKFGSRWSVIARHLPGRTDNAVKNRYNSSIQRLDKMGLLKNKYIRKNIPLEELLAMEGSAQFVHASSAEVKRPVARRAPKAAPCPLSEAAPNTPRNRDDSPPPSNAQGSPVSSGFTLAKAAASSGALLKSNPGSGRTKASDPQSRAKEVPPGDGYSSMYAYLPREARDTYQLHYGYSKMHRWPETTDATLSGWGSSIHPYWMSSRGSNRYEHWLDEAARCRDRLHESAHNGGERLDETARYSRDRLEESTRYSRDRLDEAARYRELQYHLCTR